MVATAKNRPELTPKPGVAYPSKTVEKKQVDVQHQQPTLTVQERKAIAFQDCIRRKTPFWKRAVDLTLASGLCLVLSPLLATIAVFIRATSGGPVLFKQVRLGEMGEEFVIYKFRTMQCDPNATNDHRQFVANISATDQAISKPDMTDRLIWGGAFLRKTSLDELPQLLNILLGQMSLIGPRPDVLGWEDYQPWQLRRFEVLPGVTGLWQVSGKNRLSFREMIEKDIDYVERRSIALDIRIALKTILIILVGDNR